MLRSRHQWVLQVPGPLETSQPESHRRRRLWLGWVPRVEQAWSYPRRTWARAREQALQLRWQWVGR